ncbi:uncharacterized protein LOC108217003 [Daucus carota subsp. sativus]|uniref:uncharacterized protein LOC108217003 n=1 Tax=Daucus carota subsp. sativus TaxID=79200 RepID=UPI0007EF917E|nr:PREDICTED: uncharacterized protein LOC108217003 [Daucus carota subsp. sativus]
MFPVATLIEDKIQKGQLTQFLANNGGSTCADKERVIDVISGGIHLEDEFNKGNSVYRLDSKRPRRNPSPVISFSDADYADGVVPGHVDALVITTKIGTNVVKKILIDNGSSVDILYQNAYARMDLGDRKMTIAKGSPLYGFTGNEVRVIGVIDLPVLFGSPPHQVWQMTKFHVINASCSYNAILGRTTLSALRAVTSIPHLKMKFPTEYGVGEVKGDQ